MPNRETLRVCIQIASFVASAVLLYVRTIRGEHCLVTKRFVCAVKSLLSFYPSLSRKVPHHQTLRVCIQIASFVATTVLLSVRTIRGEHCLITKRIVCVQ